MLEKHHLVYSERAHRFRTGIERGVTHYRAIHNQKPDKVRESCLVKYEKLEGENERFVDYHFFSPSFKLTN